MVPILQFLPVWAIIPVYCMLMTHCDFFFFFGHILSVQIWTVLAFFRAAKQVARCAFVKWEIRSPPCTSFLLLHIRKMFSKVVIKFAHTRRIQACLYWPCVEHDDTFPWLFFFFSSFSVGDFCDATKEHYQSILRRQNMMSSKWNLNEDEHHQNWTDGAMISDV